MSAPVEQDEFDIYADDGGDEGALFFKGVAVAVCISVAIWAVIFGVAGWWLGWWS